MSREIKFRFWDGTRGNMAMCYLTDDGCFTYPSSSFKLPFQQALKESMQTDGYNAPKHMMQYTGLKDKNGVEIYEGDIVKDANGKVWAIAWNEGFAAFGKRDPGLGKTSQPIGGLHPANQLEVIGNIYENPELLR